MRCVFALSYTHTHMHTCTHTYTHAHAGHHCEANAHDGGEQTAHLVDPRCAVQHCCPHKHTRSIASPVLTQTLAYTAHIRTHTHLHTSTLTRCHATLCNRVRNEVVERLRDSPAEDLPMVVRFLLQSATNKDSAAEVRAFVSVSSVFLCVVGCLLVVDCCLCSFHFIACFLSVCILSCLNRLCESFVVSSASLV